jgi:hypothetical protein
MLANWTYRLLQMCVGDMVKITGQQDDSVEFPPNSKMDKQEDQIVM